MAGTITATTIQNDTSSPPIFRNNSVEIGTLCRAWVNFNGTGTVAIRASFNVSSITDNGNGDYTVNFTNAMPDENYCVNGGWGQSTGGTGTLKTVRINSNDTGTATLMTASQCRTITSFGGDMSYIFMSFFR
jgi:hypothetical protein